ncbi:MAG: peptidylprolyl isomerase [Candidatus Zixiibacteriota bacterium]
MARKLLGLAGTAMAVGVALFGCSSSDTQTLAEVGDHSVTVQEFDDMFKNVRYEWATAEDEYQKRREILDTIIVNRLLVEAAYEMGIDKSEELARVVLANKDRFLLDALYQKHVASKAEATDAEVRAFYDKLENKIRASHILVNNIDTANMLLERLTSGEPMEQLAYTYSIDPSAKRNKGDLGYFVYGAMVDEFQDAAFSLEPGEISPPIKTSFGYHIIKLIDRTPNDQRTDFEQMKSSIERQIVNRKRGRLLREYMAATEAQYPITIDTAICKYLLHKRENLYPPVVLEQLPRNDFDIEQLDRNEKEMPLAIWDGGQMTVGAYFEAIKNVPANVKPDLDSYEGLAKLVFQLNQQEVLALEGRREGLDNDPEYLRKLRLFREYSMADIMRNDSIPLPPRPDEGQTRQYYDEHPDEFTSPAQIHVFEILLSDEILARKLKSEIRSLKSFKDVAMDKTERPGKRASSGDLSYIERKWFPEIFDLARKTAVGEIGGPVVTMGKYSIFYVVDKLDSALKDYLDVKASITNKLLQEQRKEAFRLWVENRREATKVVVYEDVLRDLIDSDKYASSEQASDQG